MEPADTGVMHRAAIVATLAAVVAGAGCFGSSLDSGALVPADDGAGQCTVDGDCTLAGPSCCECPTYALPVSSGWRGSCEDVDCPAPQGCPLLAARCEGGACIAACAAVACDQSCAAGFAVDAAGCQVCACADAPAACAVDGDCARVPADCCGCALGGADTAVPVADVDAHRDGLLCPPAPACPGVSTCDPAQVARCMTGRCVLLGPDQDPQPPPAPADACGRPDLPACPVAQRCLLNGADPLATRLGLGTCGP